MKANVNGLMIDYQLSGSGRLLALAHSLGMRGSIFDPVRRQLEPEARVLTWDARGHGDSRSDTRGWSIEDLALDMRGLIECIHEDRAVVAGLSMGGNTALAYALAFPDQVDGLILMDTTAGYGEDAQERWEQRASKVEREGMEHVVAFNLPRWFSDVFLNSRPDEVSRITKILLANDPVGYATACRALGRFDVRSRVQQLRCPTLMIVGEEDPATPPAMAKHLHENIAGSKLQIIQGLRHMSAVENPDLVGKLIRDFLRSL